MPYPKNLLYIDAVDNEYIIKLTDNSGNLRDVKVEMMVEKYQKGQYLFHEQNTVTGIFFILDGLVKVYKKNLFKNQIVRLSKSGDLLGHRAIGRRKFPVSAVALSDVAVGFIDKSEFQNLLYKEALFSTNVLLKFVEELELEENKLRDLANYSVLEKGKKALCLVLHYFGINEDGSIKHLNSLTRKDIGELVGLTANQVSKVLKDLSVQGIISIKGDKVFVVQYDKLFI